MHQIPLAELQRHNLLQLLLQRQVVSEAVANEQPEAAELQQVRDQFLHQNGLESPEVLKAYLLSNGISEDDLNWQIALPLRIRAHCDKHYHHKAEAHFLTRKNQLDRVVYSLLRVKDPYLAHELYLRIDAREANFADLAAQYSEGPEKKTNGIVGPVPLTQAHPALAERLRTTHAGALMTPFKVAEWWLVARLESYTPASFDAATAERMADELFNEWVREETSRKIRELLPQGVATATE